MKRKIYSVQSIIRKLRSRFPRRRRSRISPILFTSLKETVSDSIAFSHLTREASCDSSGVSVSRPAGATSKKRSCKQIGEVETNNKAHVDVFRRITRSYNRKRNNESEVEQSSGRGVKNVEMELSESSCVESCSGAIAGVFRERNSKLKSRTGLGKEKVQKIERIEDSEAVMKPDVSSVQQISRKIKSRVEKVKQTESSLKLIQNGVVSVDSGGASLSEAKFGTLSSYIAESSEKTNKEGENRVYGDEVSELSRNCAESKLTVSNSLSTTDQNPKSNAMDFDLECSEQVSYEEFADQSSAFSDLQSEIFQDSSDLSLSEYSPSIWCDSGSQFSERSVGDTSPSPTFQLFLQFAQQFCRSSNVLDSKISSDVEDDNTDQISPLRFEDVEHEESYQMIRKRERRQMYLHDYAEEYCSTTDYGELVIQQRLQMVHWIVEQSTRKELHKETMFLGVSLLDRFLSKGYFKNKKNLQIVGIACLTLATRLEENQPYNSVRQKTFQIGNNSYSRCEVVAMEWLVQEVLNFQCFLPTMYNFLWFYLKAAMVNEEVEKTAKYLAVLAVLGHEHLCYWPSTVAAGLVILAALTANQDACCHRVTGTHARTKDDNLPECIKSLQWLVKYIC